MGEHSLGRERRLRSRSDFQSLREHGSSRAHPLIVLRVMANGLLHSRFGFVVGKRVAKSAVVRNRVRRRLREAVRVMPVRPGWDILLIARAPAAEASYADLSGAAGHLLKRMDLLSKPGDDAGDGSTGAEGGRA